MSMHTGAFGESPGTLSLNPKPGTPKNEPDPYTFPSLSRTMQTTGQQPRLSDVSSGFLDSERGNFKLFGLIY